MGGADARRAGFRQEEVEGVLAIVQNVTAYLYSVSVVGMN